MLESTVVNSILNGTGLEWQTYFTTSLRQLIGNQIVILQVFKRLIAGYDMLFILCNRGLSSMNVCAYIPLNGNCITEQKF